MSQPSSPIDPVRPSAGDKPPGPVIDAGPPLRTPRSLADLAWVFTRLALQGFGGVLPIARRELVDRERWLTREQFVEMLSVAQVLPGPNVVNLALMFGDRAMGWRGAVAALFGMLAAPLAVVLALTLAYEHFAAHPAVAGALRGMSMVAAGLIFATGLELLATLRKNPLGRAVALAVVLLTAIGIAAFHVPLVIVLAVLGGGACVLAWRRLAP